MNDLYSNNLFLAVFFTNFNYRNLPDNLEELIQSYTYKTFHALDFLHELVKENP